MVTKIDSQLSMKSMKIHSHETYAHPCKHPKKQTHGYAGEQRVTDGAQPQIWTNCRRDIKYDILTRNMLRPVQNLAAPILNLTNTSKFQHINFNLFYFFNNPHDRHTSACVGKTKLQFTNPWLKRQLLMSFALGGSMLVVKILNIR